MPMSIRKMPANRRTLIQPIGIQPIGEPPVMFGESLSGDSPVGAPMIEASTQFTGYCRRTHRCAAESSSPFAVVSP
ncbi:hypothetical protein HAX54_029062, partial [Datura stramonium]|nr:hypothetical protein [Datura stramonium]